MRGSLTVRISDGVRDQLVTRYVKGLRFTKTAPGGFHSASVTIDAPEGLFGDLGPADRIFVYDGRTARTVWDGYVENPGRTTVSGGARYDLSAMGGVVVASDKADPVVFATHDMAHAHWKKIGSVASATVGQDEAVAAAVGWGPGFKAQFVPGTPLGTGAYVGMVNTSLVATGQPIYHVAAFSQTGKNDSGYATHVNAYDADGSTVVKVSAVPNFNTTLQNVTLTIPLADPAFGASQFALVATRTGGATNVADDLTWAWFHGSKGIGVRPALKDQYGAYVVPSFNSPNVLAGEVVGHLIGSGMLGPIDALGAVIEQMYLNAHIGLDNFAYLDGVKPRQILDDLSFYEPDLLWEILESNPAGLHRFNYRQWPTTPRYEISGREFTETGGEIDLCNRIAISWKDSSGAEQVTTRTAVVEALGSRTKDAEPITLPDGQGSEANATLLGDQTLAALNTLTRSGSAVVRAPILDRSTGRMAMPWEIEPGHIVRVRDIGVDLRLTEMSYDDTNCSSTLTLGTPTLTQAQRIARLGRR